MNHHIPDDGDPVEESDDFTVSQETGFDEPRHPVDDDDRDLDDMLDDEVAGIDEERHVDLDADAGNDE
ncbi:hypothetical protein [Luethyella okanaganae]|uniref:Uncharacterized protein n=1 Tax=Luethyella okanaganae TaxID=69372 RepID=A0ABW1VKM8_9MICO